LKKSLPSRGKIPDGLTSTYMKGYTKLLTLPHNIITKPIFTKINY